MFIGNRTRDTKLDPYAGDMTREDALYYAAWLTRLRGTRYVAVRVPYTHTGFECGAL